MSAAILNALWAKLPQPHQVAVPAKSSMSIRPQPQSCLSDAIRPSYPVRHLTILVNRPDF